MTPDDRPQQSDPPRPETNTLITDDERAAIRTLIDGTVADMQVGEALTIDTLFQILHDPGHRYVLTYVLQSEGFATISELVDYVVTRTDASMTDSRYRHRVTEELTHKHLPELHRLGLIQYNMERQIISPTEKTPLASPYLKVALLQQRQMNDRLED